MRAWENESEQDLLQQKIHIGIDVFVIPRALLHVLQQAMGPCFHQPASVCSHI
jgi:hypothetical protein